MRAVVQRVKSASVTVDGELISEIESGLLVFLGVSKNDTREDIDYLAQKVVNLRIFRDEESKMNKSLLDVGGSALVVSQFTLYGDCRKHCVSMPGLDIAWTMTRMVKLVRNDLWSSLWRSSKKRDMTPTYCGGVTHCRL